MAVLQSFGHELRLGVANKLEGAGFYRYQACDRTRDSLDEDGIDVHPTCVDRQGAVNALAYAYTDDPVDGGEYLGFQTDSESETGVMLDFAGSWRADLDYLSVPVPPAPSFADSGAVLSLDLIRDGRVFRAPQSVLPDANTVAEVPYPPDFADRLSLRAYFSGRILDTSSGLSNVFVDPSDAGTLTQANFMTPAELGLDTASRKISWAASEGDGATAHLYWRSQSGSSGSWSFVGPTDAGTFILPELPAGDRFFAPLEAKPRSLLWSVNVYDYPDIKGFAELDAAGLLGQLSLRERAPAFQAARARGELIRSTRRSMADGW